MSGLVAAGRERPRLGGIEALRGVAACAVVLYHAARHVDRAYGAPGLAHAFGTGHAGVDLFFVLSGFIILYVHAPDIGRPARLAHYARRRFSRVMPLYWVALVATIVMTGLAAHGLPSAARLLSSAVLLPSNSEPLLGVAWTLQFEIVFYAAFGVLVWRRAVGMAILAAWLAVVVALSPWWVGGEVVPRSLYSAFNLEFFFGMAACLLVRRGPFLTPAWLMAVGWLGFGAAGLAEFAGALDGYAAGARWAYGVAAAVLIWGIVARERRAVLAVPAALRRLGEASYAIYLFQFVFIGIVWQLLLHSGFAPHLPRLVCFALLAGAGIGGGSAVHRLVERPLLRLVRTRTSVAVAS